MTIFNKYNKNNSLNKFFRIFLAFFICVSLAMMPLDACAESKSHKSKKSSKQSSKNVKPYNPPYAHIVVDANTGKVLLQSDADRSLYPASLTKIMTLLMTFEAIDTGRLSLNSSVIFSTRATNMAPSRIGLKAGESMSVENAIKALVTKSANDVAAALAERIGGSEARFAQLMNLKARQIGMSQTHFENASGLNNVRQVSSARDMAKLSIYLMRTYPHYYKYFSLKEFTFNGRTHKNHNKLMSTYAGMDGLKTGYIAPSGFNLVASAKRGNTRLIGVVFGGKSASARNVQMAKLLDAGFSGQNYTVPAETPPVPAQKQNTSTASQAKKPVLAVKQPQLSNQMSVQPSVTYLQKPAATAQMPTNIVDASNLPPGQPPVKTAQPVQKEPMQMMTAPSNPAPAQPTANAGGTWSVQIGAYQDRVGTDQALYRALKNLPEPLNRGTPQVIPLRTSDSSWMFRARIAGYTREQATKACTYLKDCLTIAPSSN